MLKRIFIVSFCALVFLCSCSKEKLDRQEIKVYDADEVCKKDLVENIDGEDIVSSSIVYLNYDESNLVTKAIYQSISSIQDINNYTYETYSYIKDIYSNIDGVEVDYYDTSQNLVLEIAYNYESIDLNLFKENLESILDQNSLLAKVKKLPVEVSEFKKIELAGYDCKVK